MGNVLYVEKTFEDYQRGDSIILLLQLPERDARIKQAHLEQKRNLERQGYHTNSISERIIEITGAPFYYRVSKNIYSIGQILPSPPDNATLLNYDIFLSRSTDLLQ